MKRVSKIALLLVAVCAIASGSARAQQATNARPIKARFEVLHMTNTAIQVRSLVNQREIHTFSYAAGIRDQMRAIFNQGGYQYGDKVQIRYQPGSEIALKIKGKPSKPRHG